MRRVVFLLLFLLPALAEAADRYNLARILVTGSERYREEDLVRATGLIVNTQVTSDDLQNAANRLGNSGAFSSVQFLFKAAIGAKGVEADFQVADAEKLLPAVFENFVWFSESELQEAMHQSVPLYNGQLPTSGSMSDEVSARSDQAPGLQKLAQRDLLHAVRRIRTASDGVQIQGRQRQPEGTRSHPFRRRALAGGGVVQVCRAPERHILSAQ